MRCFSMFSGIGGFEVGIEKARDFTKSKREQSWGNVEERLCSDDGKRELVPSQCFTCIGYSEIDRYACSIYRRHFPEHRNFGDATKLVVSELPDFDLLVGGFPCQAFSIAGKRQGFLDARGTLFFEIARVLEYKRPRYFLLENVEGLLSHDDRRTFVAIIRILSDIGYRVSWQVLNTKDYGLPQNRERIFIAGCFGGERGPEVFPISETNAVHPGESGEDSIANCLDSSYHKGWLDKGQRTMIELTDEHHNTADVHFIEDIVALSEARSEEAKEIRRQRKDKDYSPRRAKVLQPRKDGMIQALNTSPTKDSNIIHKHRIRRLTPTECSRLQGFPDDWCDWGIDEKGKRIEISDTQKYRCLGNAVSTNVIEKIIKKWFTHAAV